MLDFVVGKVVPVVELVGEHGADEIAEDIAVQEDGVVLLEKK